VEADVRDLTDEALLRLLRADPGEWPGLAPRVAQAIGPGRLREIAETTRKATAGVDRIELDSSGWRVASGPGGRVLLWGRADPDGLVTSLWITAEGKERHPGRGQHAAWLILIVFSALAAGDTWSAHSRSAWAAGACWILFLALVVEGLGGPAGLPWWIRRTTEAVWLAGILAAVRLPAMSGGPVTASLLLSIALVVAAAAVIYRVRTRDWDAAVSVPLAFPLRGRWYVGQGGASKIVNHHVASPGQRAALDLVRTGPRGTRSGSGPGCQAYLAYGQPVFAPCDGTVLTARDGLPDQVPGIIVPQPAGGNEIVIDSGREHIRLAHLRPGTVSVTEGQHVHAGLLLGEVGNSGNTTEPHLHIEASRDGLGVDLRFAGNPGRYWRGRTLRG
jgi:hypothetical protein